MTFRASFAFWPCAHTETRLWPVQVVEFGSCRTWKLQNLLASRHGTRWSMVAGPTPSWLKPSRIQDSGCTLCWKTVRIVVDEKYSHQGWRPWQTGNRDWQTGTGNHDWQTVVVQHKVQVEALLMPPFGSTDVFSWRLWRWGAVGHRFSYICAIRLINSPYFHSILWGFICPL